MHLMDAQLRVFKPLNVDERLTLSYQVLDFAFHFLCWLWSKLCILLINWWVPAPFSSKLFPQKNWHNSENVGFCSHTHIPHHQEEIQMTRWPSNVSLFRSIERGMLSVSCPLCSTHSNLILCLLELLVIQWTTETHWVWYVKLCVPVT